MMKTLRRCKHWNREIWRSEPVGELIVTVHHWDATNGRTAHRSISLEYLVTDYDMPNGVTIPVQHVERVGRLLVQASQHVVIPDNYMAMCYGCCRADQDLTPAL